MNTGLFLFNFYTRFYINILHLEHKQMPNLINKNPPFGAKLSR